MGAREGRRCLTIFGLTHDDEGRTIQRLSVSVKLAVGLGPDAKAGRKAPSKLDHFIFLKKVADSGTDSDWVIDENLTKHYGKSPKEVEIILLSDEMEEVFPSQYAWWTKSKRICWGDGHEATRKTEEHPNGEPWQPCGRECPDLQQGRCKPSADLRFTLADFPQLGAIARIHTSSYRSIMQISSALHQVKLITAGRLAGIKGYLVVRPEKAHFKDKDGTLRTTKIPALSIEVRAAGMQRLVENMVGTAKLFEQTRRMLGTGHIQVIEGEETAPEIAGEFYNDRGEEAEKPEKRQARQERERGTLEPGKQANRGHGKEVPVQPKAAKPAPREPERPTEPEPWDETEFDAGGGPETIDMDAMCERCALPHPRARHDGDLGDGPCMDCECPGFSSVPPAPKFGTAQANVGTSPSQPKWADLHTVAGKVTAFQNQDQDGFPLKSARGAEFVIVNLYGLPDDESKNPHSKFFSYHKTLAAPLEMSLGEKIVIVYATQVTKANVVYQMIHDVFQIGAKRFDEMKEGCFGCGVRGTIRITDSQNQESAFRPEDENQAAP